MPREREGVIHRGVLISLMVVHTTNETVGILGDETCVLVGKSQVLPPQTREVAYCGTSTSNQLVYVNYISLLNSLYGYTLCVVHHYSPDGLTSVLILGFFPIELNTELRPDDFILGLQTNNSLSLSGNINFSATLFCTFVIILTEQQT